MATLTDKSHHRLCKCLLIVCLESHPIYHFHACEPPHSLHWLSANVSVYDIAYVFINNRQDSPRDTHTHTHTCTQNHIHTHAHKHTHTHSLSLSFSLLAHSLPHTHTYKQTPHTHTLTYTLDRKPNRLDPTLCSTWEAQCQACTSPSCTFLPKSLHPTPCTHNQTPYTQHMMLIIRVTVPTVHLAIHSYDTWLIHTWHA